MFRRTFFRTNNDFIILLKSNIKAKGKKKKKIKLLNIYRFIEANIIPNLFEGLDMRILTE